MKLALTLISILFISCSHPNPKVTVVIAEKLIDTSRYVVLKFDTSRDDYLFKSVDKPANLSASEDNTYWKKDWVNVDDGGSCYFQIKTNLTNNTVSGFYVNGLA